MQVPWAAGASRFTEQFECGAISLLLVASNQKQAWRVYAAELGQTHRIQCVAVRQGLARRDNEGLRHVGPDEKSFGKGHHYGTVLSNLDASCVLELVEHRTEQSAQVALGSLGAGRLEKY